MVINDHNQNLRVRVKVNDQLKDYTIVDSPNINPEQGLISWESPLAKAIQGKQPGERVNFNLPTGQVRELQILDIDRAY